MEFGGRRPIQKVLVGLIPPSCSVRRRLELAPYLPVAFHDDSPHDVCHQEHSQIYGDGNGRGGETSQRTLKGYEAMHMIRKGQLQGVPKGDILAPNRVIAEVFGVAA